MTEVGADKLSAKTSNVIQSLLSQDISGSPILSGRKTSSMKLLEEATKQRKAVSLKRKEKRKWMEEKLLASPGDGTIDFERQLRKLATKGVVALFNAIAKAKRDGTKVKQALNQPKIVGDGPSDEKSVTSDVSSITANNSYIFSTKRYGTTAANAALPTIAANTANKRSKTSESGSYKNSSGSAVSDGWDKDDDDI